VAVRTYNKIEIKNNAWYNIIYIYKIIIRKRPRVKLKICNDGEIPNINTECTQMTMWSTTWQWLDTKYWTLNECNISGSIWSEFMKMFM